MSKQRAALRQLFSLHPPPIPPDKILEIYRYLLTKCLENAVLGCPEMVHWKKIFLTPNRNMFAGKFVKWERFFIVFWEHIFSISSELRLIKQVSCFELNRIEKWVIFFASFCWLWDFLLENLKLRKNSDVHWNVRKKVVCPKKIFSKKEFQIWAFESLIICFKFRFLGDCYKAFQPMYFS